MKTKKLFAVLLLIVAVFGTNVTTAATPTAKNSPNAKQKTLVSKLPKKGKIVNETLDILHLYFTC